jgi:dihydroxyacetone kinase phosphotransfer subunit
LVVVSHSAALADAVVDLVRQLTNLDASSGPRLVAAGGMADGSLGTDATRIADAVAAADAGAGVVITADLGSALLSAFTALDDLLAPATSTKVLVSNGPIVEGTFVAAVQAAAGDSVEDVAAAADAAGAMDKLGDRR